jgi:phage/plasmid-like protein (TIGR03299 family)
MGNQLMPVQSRTSKGKLTMAHEITKTSGVFEFAFRADHGAPWHVKETGADRAVPLADLDDVDAWKRHAGMQWEAGRSRVRFGEGANQRTWDDQHVLYRKDTKAPLGIVSPGYKIVQPGELFDQFRGIVGVGGLQMSAAGTTGREFWATAKFSEGTVGSRKDMLQGFVLIHSSLDGSRATTVRRVVERAVCNNTIQMAFEESQAANAVYKVTHRTKFDPETAKAFMDLNMDAWNAAKSTMLRLANALRRRRSCFVCWHRRSRSTPKHRKKSRLPQGTERFCPCSTGKARARDWTASPAPPGAC